MNKALVIAGVGGLLLLMTASTRKAPAKDRRDLKVRDLKVRGFPIDLPAFTKLVDARSMPEKNADYLMKTLNAPTIQVALGKVSDELRARWTVARNAFAVRRTLLPKDAKGVIDQYSKERYQLPPAQFSDPWPHSLWVDEFGREPAGLPSNFGTTFLTIAQQVAPMIPGVGTAAGAALSFAIAIGQGKSFKDATLAAARGALPPQYQFAFDLGVGVANGQGVDEAAKEAFFHQVPGSRETYEQGKSLAKKVGIS